ncbi:MAG: hypothetical protein KA321_02245 [Pseudomonadales bacterium]|nr:hypothetical protein [Pseudomonadales bacterium]
MKIQGSQIEMRAAHAEQRQQRVERELQVSVTRAAPAPVADADAVAGPADPALDAEIRYLQLLIEMLSGRAVRIAAIDAGGPGEGGVAGDVPAAPSAQLAFSARTSEHYSEAETSAFAADATVQTADGREMHIALSLLMQRRFESTTSVTVSAGARKDPLLLNLAGNGPELSALKYAFDLDADGTAEMVSMAAGQSAFVALDRNGDGRINDGRELFGALSGDGFAELARHDDDGNGFIDAGDAVYARLLALSKDARGSDVLTPLAALGIGALYLGSVETPFSVNTAANETLAVVRRSGLWIGEDLSAGTLQQLDLVV